MPGFPDWKERLATNDRGDVRANLANVIQALETNPDWAEKIRFNEMAQAPFFDERPFTDADGLEIAAALQRECMPNLNHRLVADAVTAVAARNPFNPLQQHLSSLQWDGQSRLDFWLTRYAGVEAADYSNLVGRYWLLSAVARAFKPGCKADHMIVLEGAQGVGKSSLLRILGGEWFKDQLPDLTSKDASTALRNSWVVEVAELRATRRAEADAIKEFLSRQVETFRPPYSRFDVHEPRACVLAGTSNELEGYLRDTTGARRFWPVQCGRIDLEAFKRDRNQLLAQAVSEFHAGSEWWPTAIEQRAIFAPQQEARQAVDPWREALQTALGGVSSTTVIDAADYLGLRAGAINSATARRISECLAAVGFSRGRLDPRTRRQTFERNCEGLRRQCEG
jgi:predicted P-loop ATPase